ncbi:MAG: hypothetical protein NUV91_04565 [Candidatus Omnitrophica bacterium]|nr:hypothetical protein [Candidatus Omnitrophota bacterium]
MTNMYRELDDILQEIGEQDPRYKQEAYEFVLESLSYAQKRFRRPKHVNGKELLEGMKILLMEKFGPMTMTVLNHWGICSTEDFGNIVFNLVEKKVLSKTDDDQIESFKNVFDFQKVFDSGYREGLAKKISRMR